MNARRLVPLAGVVAIALFVVSAIIGGETPDADSSAAKAVSYYTENDTDTIVSSVIAALGVVFFVFFLGALRSALRRAEGDTGGLSAVSFGGGLLVAVGMSLFVGLSFTLGDAADKLDPVAVQALNALNADMFPPLVIGTAVFTLTTGLAVLRTGVFPKWLGWVAIVLFVLSLTPVGFFVFLAFLLWIVVVSIMLSLRADQPATG